jgi:hypothetical protein
MLDKLVVCDATGGDHFAALVAMAVERHTPQGIFRATFPAGDGTTRHYKAFGNAHPRNLKPWA